MKNILKKAQNDHILTKDEIIQLLLFEPSLLYKAADRTRAEYMGDEVHLRGLIEFSNICRQNCLYCGIRKDNPHIERYRLTEDEVFDFAERAIEYGFKTIVMQSGEDAYFCTEKMCRIISKIKGLGTALTLSLGEKNRDEYKAYKDAGADRYLIRIETTDENLYKKMHPSMDFQNRKRCLNDLKDLGFEAGTGCLVGLPGQSIESLADDILFFKEIDADMIGIGPFIPNENTPLKDDAGGTLEMALKVMAITRLLLPDINIPATTAMEALHPKGRIMALQCGANVVMPNVTEGGYRKKYELYPGKIAVNESAQNCLEAVKTMVQSIGRTVSEGRGFRANKNQLF